jgi:hypothetical protein
MKGPALLVLLFLLSVDASAQSSHAQPDAPDLTVTKKFWRKEIDHPALTVDPFRANDEQAELQRAQKDNAIRNRNRVREGDTPQPTVRNAKPMSTQADGGPTTWFVYRITVKNSGTKTITNMVWEYVFVDSEKGELVGRHSFQHRIKIRAGKSTELIGQSGRPPTSVIDAAKAKKGETQLTEEVVIRRIEYEDGSFWQRPLN